VTEQVTASQLWNRLVAFSEEYREKWGYSPNEAARTRFILSTFDVRHRPAVPADTTGEDR
jgi:hypothetical protein